LAAISTHAVTRIRFISETPTDGSLKKWRGLDLQTATMAFMGRRGVVIGAKEPKSPIRTTISLFLPPGDPD
jgi:hypothetical protein